MEKIYSISATSVGGRNGKVTSEDKVIELELRSPGAPGSEGHANPEMLFAAGYSACFNSALAHLARFKKIHIGESRVTAQVTLGKDTEGNFRLGVAMNVEIPGTDQKTAEMLAGEAHQMCPYSRATRGNIDFEMAVKAI